MREVTRPSRSLAVRAAGAVAALGLGLAAAFAAAPSAHAATVEPPTVRIGKTACGQTQVWVDGKPLFLEVDCVPR